jgi:hypothetical protein
VSGSARLLALLSPAFRPTLSPREVFETAQDDLGPPVTFFSPSGCGLDQQQCIVYPNTSQLFLFELCLLFLYCTRVYKRGVSLRIHSIKPQGSKLTTDKSPCSHGPKCECISKIHASQYAKDENRMLDLQVRSIASLYQSLSSTNRSRARHVGLLRGRPCSRLHLTAYFTRSNVTKGGLNASGE